MFTGMENNKLVTDSTIYIGSVWANAPFAHHTGKEVFLHEPDICRQTMAQTLR
jgi:hypothetical protein